MSQAMLTNVGRNKEAAALANGTPMQIAEIAWGDGERIPFGGETALLNEVGRKDVSNHGAVDGTPNAAFFEILLDEAEGPFVVREAGLFDVDGDMIAIALFDPPVNKPLDTVSALIRINVVFSNLENMVLPLAPYAAYVPSERVVSSGAGLTGGGDLSQNRTFAVDLATGAEMSAGTPNKVADAKRVLDLLGSMLAAKLDAADYTSADVLAKLKAVDGSGSGLNADLLDGLEAAFLRNAGNLNAGILPMARLSLASLAEAQSGERNDRVMTPLRVADAIAEHLNALLNGAPAALDTLKELADAIGENDSELAALVAQIGTKLDASAFTGASVLALLLAEDAPYVRHDEGGLLLNVAPGKQIYMNWSSDNRFLLAPRFADDSNWDWSREFWFDAVARMWGVDDAFHVKTLMGNPVIERFTRIDAKRDGASYKNAALILGSPRSDTEDGETVQGRGLLTALGQSTDTQAGPVWLASRSSGISADHSDDDIKGYNGFGIRLDANAMEVWRGGVMYMRLSSDGRLRIPEEAGGVQAFAGSAAPAGWLKCNGAAISRTAYADLFAVIGTTYGAGDGNSTFNIPDLRGEFLRGWDNGRGVDAGRALGSAQADELKAHTHDLDTTGMGGGYAGPNEGGLHSGTGKITPTEATGGSETRPRNIAMMFCIKY